MAGAAACFQGVFFNHWEPPKYHQTPHVMMILGGGKPMSFQVPCGKNTQLLLNKKLSLIKSLKKKIIC